jgi:ArsR family transcriptional regulator, lead/cadmium/zinc/bismuth-responsive transcriptional repressor
MTSQNGLYVRSPLLHGTHLSLVCERGLCYHYDMRANIKTKADTIKKLPMVAPEDLCNIPCFKGDVVTRVKRQMPAEDALEDTRVLFAALADRARLKILHALKGGEELCVCDVAHVLGSSVSTASHHLRKLRDLKLLKYRNDGKMAYYSLRDDFAAALAATVLERGKR